MTAPEPATTAERVAELERQLTQLRADFNASTLCLEAAFAAGAEYGRTGGPGRQPASRSSRHLRAVAEPEMEAEL